MRVPFFFFTTDHLGEITCICPVLLLLLFHAFRLQALSVDLNLLESHGYGVDAAAAASLAGGIPGAAGGGGIRPQFDIPLSAT